MIPYKSQEAEMEYLREREAKLLAEVERLKQLVHGLEEALAEARKVAGKGSYFARETEVPPSV